MDTNTLKYITDSGNKLNVKSALNPILWLCAISYVTCILCLGLIVTVYKTGFPIWVLSIIVLTLTIVPVLTAGIGFLYLLFQDRDKLQSEKFQLEKKQMEISQQKGDSKPQITPKEDERAVEELENETK